MGKKGKFRVKTLSVSGEYLYIPQVIMPFEGADGKVENKSNRDLPKEYQIKVTLRLANFQQSQSYQHNYDYADVDKGTCREVVNDFERAVRNHVVKIVGLEEFGIKDGDTLVEKHMLCEETAILYIELYRHIMNPFDNTTGEEEVQGTLTSGE